MSLYTPMFEGQYRSKPTVSLGGTSRKEERERLLDRASREREERELHKRQISAATKIQAHYRGHTCRQMLKRQLEGDFNRKLLSCDGAADVLVLSRMFVPHVDLGHDLLIKLCQKWLHHRTAMVDQLATVQPPSLPSSRHNIAPASMCAYHLRSLLGRCCRDLIGHASQPLAVPLRTLEVFTSPETYASSAQHAHAHAHAQWLLQDLLLYLSKHGFFLCLRTVLEQRAPLPSSRAHPPSPLASSITTYVNRAIEYGPRDRGYYHLLVSELFGDRPTPHTQNLVLSLSSNKYFPFDLFMAALLPPFLPLQQRQTHCHVHAPSVLYALVSLISPNFDQLGPECLSQYLLCFSSYLSLSIQCMEREGEGGEEEEEEEEEGEWEDLDLLNSSTASLVRCCVRMFSSTSLARRLLNFREHSKEMLESLCSVCYHLVVTSPSPPHTSHPPTSNFLQRLALNSNLLREIWTFLNSISLQRNFGSVACVHLLAQGVSLPSPEATAVSEALVTFATLLATFLSTLHDAEFYGDYKGVLLPLSLKEMGKMVATLVGVLVMNYGKYEEARWNCLRNSILCLLWALYERNSRRPFCAPSQWEALNLNGVLPEFFLETESEVEAGFPGVPRALVHKVQLLCSAPFVFPFVERVRFFQQLIEDTSKRIQGSLQDFLIGPTLRVTARRNHIYEDAFSELSHGVDLRNRLSVNLVNAQGLDEAGIDGGGLFREFLAELLRTGFDPNRGFFTTTADALLYPNPQAVLLNEEFASHFHFLGTMLGKALYEHFLVELPFAGFFLWKLCSGGRGGAGTHHLSSLDPELYKNLLSLKHYHGDLQDLSLNFTIANDYFGHSSVLELKENGANIPVTRENCVEYIHLVANYKMNGQIERQFQAFRQGLSQVIPLRWLRLFNQFELQVLISGAEVPIDIGDLRNNTKYSGEYGPDHKCIELFWSAVESFNDSQRKLLLKFVTSCSRPPLLGFKELYPPFCVLSAGHEDRLPSASTCMNLLKLPMFTDYETMHSRLLYAISSGAGFELS